jgi:EmrB/QacA subfamily drug resistance transporter
MDRKWWTLIAVCVATFMLLLDVTIVNVALPDIQSSLKATFSDLQWVVDAYALLLAALLLTTGSLADLYGRKRVFVVGLIIFILSSLASGLAQSPLWLNLARGAQGIGGAAMFSTSLALLGSAFQGRERGTAFGVWGAITGLAVAIGPVVGGALTSGLSWRWIFLVNVPIGIVAVVLTMLRVEESRQPGSHRIDPIGVITFSGSLGALVYALIKANDKGWGSTLILVLLAAAAVGLLLFVIAEAVQKDRAMFDLALFRKPTFTGGLIAAFALSGGLFALFLYLTLYLQDVLGYSALQTGVRFLVLSGGILLTSTLAGRLTAHVPIRFLIAPGLALVGIGLLLMRGVHAGTHWQHLIPGFIVSGAGVGLVNPPLASTAIGVVTPDRAGMASGINSTFRQVGIATGIAGLGTLFAHSVSTHIESALRGTAGVSSQAAHALARTVAQGSGAASGLTALPAKVRPAAAHAVKASFTTGLNEIFLVGALLALVAAVLTLVLIRSKDFESGAARGGSGPPRAAGGEAAGESVVAEPAAGEPAVAEPARRSAEASKPVPAGQGASANQLLRGAEAVIAAAGEASRDYERRVEEEIERHRAEQLTGAEEQSRILLAEATERTDRYAQALRRRLHELGGERKRLVAELRERTVSVARHADEAADTRSRLYRVIGELGSFDADRARSRALSGNGSANGRTSDGDGDGTAASSPPSPRAQAES